MSMVIFEPGRPVEPGEVRHRVLLGLPGPTFRADVVITAIDVSRRHVIIPMPSPSSVQNFQILWAHALNEADAANVTHYAQIHSDVVPDIRNGNFLNILLDRMDATGVSFMSVPVAMKDTRFLLSCGVGDEADPFSAYRRVTLKELRRLPPLFGAKEIGHPGRPLLHNNGCFVADLRDRRFHTKDANGDYVCDWIFPAKVGTDPETGKARVRGQFEDWYFSMQMHKLGIPSLICQEIPNLHWGPVGWPSHYSEGQTPGPEFDEETRHKWGKEVETTAAVA
jgi:hypothetical protein